MRINKFGWAGRDLERTAFDVYRSQCDRRGIEPMLLDYSESQRVTIEEQTRVYQGMLKSLEVKYSWEIARKLSGEGRLPGGLGAWQQLIGDCVAVSVLFALYALAIKEVGVLRQEEKIWRGNPSWTYGTGRNFIADSKIPGRDGQNDGMLGVWAARSVNECGILYEGYDDVPKYSKETCDWGSYKYWKNTDCKWHLQYGPFARPHSVLAVRCGGFSDLRKIINAGGVGTIASTYGFKMQYDRSGRHVYVNDPRNPWGHQMSITDIDETPEFTGIYRMNQWGEENSLMPKNGEIRGGAWYSAEALDLEIKKAQCEMYGYIGLAGCESEPNWGLI